MHRRRAAAVVVEAGPGLNHRLTIPTLVLGEEQVLHRHA
jgi:hypothetical protein